jgi:membrane-associated phospholipid phosphatase
MHDGVVRVPPTSTDVAVAQLIEQHVTPEDAAVLRALTWLADEKLIIATAAAAWGMLRCVQCSAETRRRTDHILLSACGASVLAHLLKHLLNRTRPDRTVVPKDRHGLPRSGNPNDSFPSGHALQLGAVGMALSRVAPMPLRVLIWPTAAALLGTRLGLLAHYPTDVLVGLALGLALEHALNEIPQRPARRPQH